MKIKSIKASNLKGKSFSHELGPVTVFTGKNDAGKSSRLDAIPLALFGYHRSLPRTNQAIFKLSSGSVMTVGVGLDDGSMIVRNWSESRGSVKADVIGSVPDSVIPLGFDAAEYFSLSDRERVKLAFKLSECVTDFPTLVLAKAKLIKLDDHNAAAEEVVNSVCNTIMGPEVAKGASLSNQEWLEACAEFAKTKCSSASAAAKRMTSTLEGLSELRAKAAAPVNSAAERELAAINKEIASVSAQRQAAVATLDLARKRFARKVELQGALAHGAADTGPFVAQISALEREVTSYKSLSSSIEMEQEQEKNQLFNANREIKALELELEQAQQSANKRSEASEILDPEGENALMLASSSEFIAQRQPQVQHYASRSRAALDERNDINRRLGNEEAAIRLLEAVVADKQQKLSALAALHACPYCEAASEGWQQQVRSKLESEAVLAGENLQACRENKAAAVERLAELALEIQASEAEDVRVAKLVEKLADATANLSIATAERDRANAILMEDSGRLIAQIESDIRDQMKLVSDLNCKSADIIGRLHSARQWDVEHGERVAELAALRLKLQNANAERELSAKLRGELESLSDAFEPASAGTAAFDATLLQLNARLQPLTLEVRQANAAKGEIATKIKAAEDAQKITMEAQCWKEVKSIVDEIQQEAVDKAIGPILERANKIAGQILPSPLAYKDGKIGRFGDRSFISCETFGGSAQAVTYAAVAVALAAGSKCGCRVAIVDEMDRLTQENKVKLIEAVLAAIKDGSLDQFIGCDVRGSDYHGLVGVELAYV